MPEKAIEATSERARQVDEYVKEHAAELKEKYPNATEGELKQIAAIETRPEKVSMTREQIDSQFTERLSNVGLTKEDIAQGVQKAAEQAKEQSTEYIRMNEYEIVRTAAIGLAVNHSRFLRAGSSENSLGTVKGRISLPQLQQAVKEMSKGGDKDLVRLSESHTVEGKGNRTYNDQVYTTPAVLAAEKGVMSYAKHGQGNGEQIMTQKKQEESTEECKQQEQMIKPDFKLTDGQRQAAGHILSNEDRVILIQGRSRSRQNNDAYSCQ